MARGMIVDLAVHEGKSENEEEPDNPHFHVLAPIRPFTEKGIWGNKQRREYILDEDGNRVKDARGKEMFISLKESIQWMKTAYEELKAELDRRQNPTLLESLQDYYDKTQGRPPLPNFYAEMKRSGKNLSNLQEFAKSISYIQTHQIETMDDLQERIEELNCVVSVSKKEISEKWKQLKE